MEASKRKTRTSNAVKQRYNAKTYDQLNVRVKKEVSALYKAKCDRLGISYSEPIHEAIKKFIEEQ